MARVAVAINTYCLGFGDARTDVSNCYRVLELVEALSLDYDCDAHLVTYVLPGKDFQPRINKSGISTYTPLPEVDVFFCDVDNADHSDWTGELLDAALQKYHSAEVLKTAGIYHTQHGSRIMQPIQTPIPVTEVEPYLRGWLSRLEQAGLAVDWACKDWTRHFRMPNVIREGTPFKTPYIALERMVPIELEPIALPPPDPFSISVPKQKATASAIQRPAVNWQKELPAVWQKRVPIIAEAVCEVKSAWHVLFMALAGCLVRSGTPADLVPLICRAISIATGNDTRTFDRTTSAQTTLSCLQTGAPFTGFTRLKSEWPQVAEAYERAMQIREEPESSGELVVKGSETNTTLPAPAEPDPSPLSLEQSSAVLHEVLRQAPDGLTLIAAECGLGKTAAAITVAAERAGRSYASPKAQGKRAPAFSKTAISVDKNDLALQIVADLAQRDVQAKRLFGPLSLKSAEGTPVCHCHEIARPLVDGGQAMQWDICDGRDINPCPKVKTCPARRCFEGPEEARITVGPHQLLKALNGEAGTTGLLVIDEPPEPLETLALSLKDLEDARHMLHAFESKYVAAIRPALEALKAWAEWIACPGQPTSLLNAILLAAPMVDPLVITKAHQTLGIEGDILDLARGIAQNEDKKNISPLIKYPHLQHARLSAEYARKLGRASKVLKAVGHGATAKIPMAVRVEESQGAGSNVSAIRKLHLTYVNEHLAGALKREGAVVATDANIALHAPIYAKIVGYKPPLHTFSAPDGAPIERTLVETSRANRKHWLPDGKLELTAHLLSSLKALCDWAAQDPAARKLGIITYLTVELAIRAALEPDSSAIEKRWLTLGQHPQSLAQAREKLTPILQRFKGQILLGHYYATRGLNTMADVDCLATLGDPWPNLNKVSNDLAFLGMQISRDERVTDYCRAELQQAHGRLRTIHRQRPGRALHVGKVIPGGYGWEQGEVKVIKNAGGRPKQPSFMAIDELKAIVRHHRSIRKTAQAIRCDHKTISYYLSGGPISKEVAECLIRSVKVGK